jgi:phosphatidylglycerophosphate synthase
MKQPYTLKDIIASYVPEKKAADGPWSRFVLRPLSFFFSKLFFALGFSPNTVSYISALLAVTAFFIFSFGSGVFIYAGFFLFFLFGVLDCADGNMARTIALQNAEPRFSRYGEWIDAVSGYIAYAAFFLGIGALEGSRFWMLAAAVALAGNLLARLAFQNYRAAAPEGRARKQTGGERKLSESIGITGILVPLSLAAYIFNLLWVVITLYAAVYCGGFLLIILKIIKNFEKNPRGFEE